MELTELRNKIISAYKGDKSRLEEIFEMMENDKAVFPFNEYELMTNTFIAEGNISYDTYIEIRQEYLSKNPHLWLFEMSGPRTFGESFAQTYILAKSPKIKPASKRLDSDYKNQYDLWCDGIRIEVKASRVVDADMEKEALYKKALSSGTKKRFLMNFQQLKPQCCDVFVWMAVYRDDITIWIMNSREVVNHPDYSRGQHRGNSGNEGQLHINESNIKTLNKYKFKGLDMAAAIRKAAKR